MVLGDGLNYNIHNYIHLLEILIIILIQHIFCRWLIDNIIENYKILNERVEEDMADYAILIQKDRDEWKRRTESNNHQIENDAIIANGNPFQPINTLIVRFVVYYLIENVLKKSNIYLN